jgi:hypothetical protein
MTGMKRVATLLAAMCIASVPALAQAPDTVQFERLTWTEIRGAIQAGKTTIIIPVGGTEQSGPYIAVGNKTILAKFYQVALRKKIYRSIEALQADLDVWIPEYNTIRTHQGRWCYGKTPMQTFIDTLPVAKEKLLQAA